MTNWKTYRITSKEICETLLGPGMALLSVAYRTDFSEHIKFGLDDYVRFRDGDKRKYVCCANDSPFNNWNVGDYIEIDNDNRLYSDYLPSLDDRCRDAIRFVRSKDSMALVSLQNQTTSLQQRCSNLVLRNNSLQKERDDLQVNNNDLQKQIEEKDRLINNGAAVLRTTQTQLTTTQNQVTQLNGELTTTRNQVTSKETQIGQLNTQIATNNEKITQLTNERDIANEQLTLTRGQLEELRTLFNNLQIANNSKDQAIKGLKDDITKKDKEIIALKAQLGILSPEEVLNKKIASGEKELDNLIRGFLFSRPAVIDLCSAYRKLEFNLRIKNNHVNIANARSDIERIKQELFAFASEKQIDNDDLHKVYQTCEQIAKWKIELEQLYQQQYQARQEIPTNQ